MLIVSMSNRKFTHLVGRSAVKMRRFRCFAEFGAASHRIANAIGECVCQAVTLEIGILSLSCACFSSLWFNCVSGGKCVGMEIFAPSIVVPSLVLLFATVYVYILFERRKSDSLWVVWIYRYKLLWSLDWDASYSCFCLTDTVRRVALWLAACYTRARIFWAGKSCTIEEEIRPLTLSYRWLLILDSQLQVCKVSARYKWEPLTLSYIGGKILQNEIRPLTPSYRFCRRNIGGLSLLSSAFFRLQQTLPLFYLERLIFASRLNEIRDNESLNKFRCPPPPPSHQTWHD